MNFFFNIDVVGSCNLRCPSCPMGNSRGAASLAGQMEPELLRRILEKATRECSVSGVALFNWTEPFLHSKLPELVTIVRDHGVVCTLSSNLNFIRNLKELLEAGPDSLRVSASGFTQQVYSATHRGGDIERVKANMVELARMRDATRSKTQVHVLYHRYLGNLDDELLMRRFAEGLGFAFATSWAFLMPIEKIFAFIKENRSSQVSQRMHPGPVDASSSNHDFSLTSEDRDLIAHLALPLDEALEASRASTGPCGLRDRQMTLDCRGTVQLCCGIFDSSECSIGSYLEVPHAELQRRKYAHPWCAFCMAEGVHIYCTTGTRRLDQVGRRHLTRHYATTGVPLGNSADMPLSALASALAGWGRNQLMYRAERLRGRLVAIKRKLESMPNGR